MYVNYFSTACFISRALCSFWAIRIASKSHIAPPPMKTLNKLFLLLSKYFAILVVTSKHNSLLKYGHHCMGHQLYELLFNSYNE